MFNTIYKSCYELGHIFGFGAWEGFIIYVGVVVWGFNVASNVNKANKK